MDERMKLPNLLNPWRAPRNRIDANLGAVAIVAGIDSLWAMEPRAANSIRGQIERLDLNAHAQEYAASFANIGAEDKDDAEAPYFVDDDGIATLCISGTMTKAPLSWGRNSSTSLLRRAVRQASSDESVRAIALIIDSPGGQVAGTADLAAAIGASGKPIGAYIEDMGCSAAYWAASQADFIYCNSTAEVGSIGTLLVIPDTFERASKDGVKINVIGTGMMKGVGTSGAAISEEQLADLRREVDEVNAQFASAVAIARGLTTEEVLGLEARVFVGAKAKEQKLVDAVTSLEDFFDDLKSAMEPVPKDALSSLSILTGRPEKLGAAFFDADPNGGGKENDMAGKTGADPTGTAVDLTFEQQALLGALDAMGISDVSDFKVLRELADFGKAQEAVIREQAKAEAVRAHGAEIGASLAETCAQAPISALLKMSAGWTKLADSKFDIGAAGGERKSAPPRYSLPADGDVRDPSKLSAWDRLSDSQKAMAETMGAKDDKTREMMAAEFLSLTSGGK